MFFLLLFFFSHPLINSQCIFYSLFIFFQEKKPHRIGRMEKVKVTKSTFNVLLMVTLVAVYFVPTATAGGYSEIHRKQDVRTREIAIVTFFSVERNRKKEFTFYCFTLFSFLFCYIYFLSFLHQGNGNYNFGYGIKDHDHGSESFHKESGDHANNKWGSYGIKDSDGRWRIVNYVADKNGFRASIESNEPGVGSQNPAHVVINGPGSEYGHPHHEPISKQHHEPLHRGYIQEYPHEDPYHNNDHYDDIGHQVDDNLDHLNVPGIDGPIPGLDAIPISAAASSSSTKEKIEPQARASTASNATTTLFVRTDALKGTNSNISSEERPVTGKSFTLTTATTTKAKTIERMTTSSPTMTMTTMSSQATSSSPSPSSSPLPVKK